MLTHDFLFRWAVVSLHFAVHLHLEADYKKCSFLPVCPGLLPLP